MGRCSSTKGNFAEDFRQRAVNSVAGNGGLSSVKNYALVSVKPITNSETETATPISEVGCEGCNFSLSKPSVDVLPNRGHAICRFSL